MPGTPIFEARPPKRPNSVRNLPAGRNVYTATGPRPCSLGAFRPMDVSTGDDFVRANVKLMVHADGCPPAPRTGSPPSRHARCQVRDRVGRAGDRGLAGVVERLRARLPLRLRTGTGPAFDRNSRRRAPPADRTAGCRTRIGSARTHSCNWRRKLQVGSHRSDSWGLFRIQSDWRCLCPSRTGAHS